MSARYYWWIIIIIISGQSNLTYGHISAADGRFSRIHRVVPMSPPMRALWRHLANTIELVLPSAHLSPQPKRQIDWFSHLCTAHGRVSSGMPGHVLSPNNCPFAWGIWAPSNNICFHNSNGISIGSAVFLGFTAEWPYTLLWAAPFPPKLLLPMGDLDTHLTHGSFGSPESSTQIASWLVQQFLQGSLLRQTTDGPWYSVGNNRLHLCT